MAKVVEVLNAADIVAALRARTKVHAAAVQQALIQAGLWLQRASQAIVPIDTGDLRRSAFTRHSGTGFQVIVRVGYTQSYAIYVHEDLNARHAPGKQAKYLEEPARTGRATMGEIIRKVLRSRLR